MDLAPGRSFIEWAVQHGRTVFAISYKNPSADMSGTTMDDYLVHGPQTALDVIEEITGADTIDIVGLCLGGAMTAITAAYLTQDGDSRIGTLTLLNTMLDYAEPGALGAFTDMRTVERLEKKMRKEGALEGETMAGTFDILRANDLIFNYVVSNWLMGQQPPAFDILAWNADSTRMPAAMHAFYLRNFYVENKLAAGPAADRRRAPSISGDQEPDLRGQRDQRPHRAVGVGVQDGRPGERAGPVRARQRRAHRRHRQPAGTEGLAPGQPTATPRCPPPAPSGGSPRAGRPGRGGRTGRRWSDSNSGPMQEPPRDGQRPAPGARRRARQRTCSAELGSPAGGDYVGAKGFRVYVNDLTARGVIHRSHRWCQGCGCQGRWRKGCAVSGVGVNGLPGTGSGWRRPASSRDRLREAMASAAITGCSSWPRSCTASSIAATTSPPGPNTGIATPQTPGFELPAGDRHPGQPGHRQRPPEPVGRGDGVLGVGPQPAHDRHLDRAGGRERQQRAAERGRVRRQGGRRGEGRCRPGSGLLLDVGDLEFVQHAEPGPALGGRGRSSSTHGARSAMLGGQASHRADHAQRQAGPVVTVVGALQQPPGGQLRGEPVRGGDRQPGEPGDFGQRMFAALGEGQQDGRDLAGDRSPGFGGVARHWNLLSVSDPLSCFHP